MSENGQTASSGTPPREYWRQALSNFDLPKFFEALPTDAFAAMIDDLEERISDRRRTLEGLKREVDALEAQAANFKQALEIREKIVKARERERAVAARDTHYRVLSPKRKRAEVLRIFEEHPGTLLTPHDVRQALARAGLLDPANESGTPVRILLAQLNEAGVLTRPESGRYRLKTREERLSVVDQS